MKKIITSLLAAAVVGTVGFSYYLGVFETVNIEQSSFGPHSLLYIEQKGDYMQTGENIEKVRLALNEIGINPKATFGIFFDNPEVVDKEKLRSEVGVVINEEDVPKTTSVWNKFRYKKYSSQQSLVAKIPFKNMASIFVGVFKVYPAMRERSKELGIQMGPAFELYEEGKEITYAVHVGPAPNSQPQLAD